MSMSTRLADLVHSSHYPTPALTNLGGRSFEFLGCTPHSAHCTPLADNSPSWWKTIDMFSVGIDQGRWGEPRFSWQWGWRVVGKWTAGDYTQLYSPGQSDTLTTKIWSLPAWPPSPRLGYPGLSCLQARLWGLSSIFCKLFLKEEIMIASEGLGGEPHSCHLRIIFHIKIPNAQSLPLIKFPYINFAINSEQNWFPARTWSSYQTPHPKGGGRETSQIRGGGWGGEGVYSAIISVMCK